MRRLVLVILLLVPCAVQAQNPTWQLVATTGPEDRYEAEAVYDTARQRVILFGGTPGSGVGTNETWGWDGSRWVQLADSGPPPRYAPAMAYDAARDRVVLFGGIAGGVRLGDTWEWDGSRWSQVASTGPQPRAAACTRSRRKSR